MVKKSAGLLIFRARKSEKEVLLVHPGGPYWQNKDLGSWSIPKGEFEESEDPLAAAKRETHEEIGAVVTGEFIPLSPVKQKSGKTIYAWAVKKDIDLKNFTSNTFEMEWPPKSGRKEAFPEVDKAEWFNLQLAKVKIIPGQLPLLEELEGLQE